MGAPFPHMPGGALNLARLESYEGASGLMTASGGGDPPSSGGGSDNGSLASHENRSKGHISGHGAPYGGPHVGEAPQAAHQVATMEVKILGTTVDTAAHLGGRHTAGCCTTTMSPPAIISGARGWRTSAPGRTGRRNRRPPLFSSSVVAVTTGRCSRRGHLSSC